MDLSQFSLDKLKSLAYEQFKLLNQTQTNLQILETEINKRGQEKISEETSEASKRKPRGDVK